MINQGICLEFKTKSRLISPAAGATKDSPLTETASPAFSVCSCQAALVSHITKRRQRAAVRPHRHRAGILFRGDMSLSHRLAVGSDTVETSLLHTACRHLLLPSPLLHSALLPAFFILFASTVIQLLSPWFPEPDLLLLKEELSLFLEHPQPRQCNHSLLNQSSVRGHLLGQPNNHCPVRGRSSGRPSDCSAAMARPSGCPPDWRPFRARPSGHPPDRRPVSGCPTGCPPDLHILVGPPLGRPPDTLQRPLYNKTAAW